MSNKSGTSDNVISLPSGGGAQSGIGETFSPDLFTGTGNFAVPIALPAGRNGLQPSLSLTYSTGNGNGPFGLGWGLSIPNVTRKTSKGIPKYLDDSSEFKNQDTFLLSGSEDLVPVSVPEVNTVRYRPRTESLFALIDRVQDNQNDFWRVKTKNGLTSFYGSQGSKKNDTSVVADPNAKSKVFCWKLSKTVDTFGNQIQYSYLRNTLEEGPHHWDQLYPDTIRYVDFEKNGETRFLVSIKFVYEDRPDSFSTYRSGFEIRTRLRCKRVEVRTHAENDLLIRTYNLIYLDDQVKAGDASETSLPLNGVSLLSRVEVMGHDGDEIEELPPLDFGYTTFDPSKRSFQSFEAENNSMPVKSLADDDYEMVDLFGNGLPDIVQMNGTMQFWKNLGGGKFTSPQSMNEIPAGVKLKDPGVQFADLNGNGRADLLTVDQGGYFPLSFQGRWSQKGFVKYEQLPIFALQSPELRFIDLDGDGVVDALRTGTDFELFFNNPSRGWNAIETKTRGAIEEFPNINFADKRVKLADMTGDGLQDIVFVEQGQMQYWPYLGYGKWANRVTMQDSPVIQDKDAPPGLGFDPDRLLIEDIDGDGLADVIYVEPDRIRIWINQQGNGFKELQPIKNTPRFTAPDSVRIADMLGNGTAGILWTTDQILPSDSSYNFLDLTGGTKSYLLKEMRNNLGAVTRVNYAPSTKFYEKDAENSKTQWKTPLPFPIQVVEQVEIIDQISKGKLTTKYQYHGGYWDGSEREFRGFGRVDQLDTETFDSFNGPGLLHKVTDFHSVNKTHFSPPTLTKIWFHLGPIGNEFDKREEGDFTHEYWSEDSSKLERPKKVTDFLENLSASHRADALRTFRGSALRTELYALDGTAQENRPFTVSENGYGIREESLNENISSGTKRIFFPHLLGQRTTQWERGNDPMTQFSFMTDFDPFGQPLTQTQIACPRGWRNLNDTFAQPFLATRSSTKYAIATKENVYIADRVAKSTAFEIENEGNTSLLALKETPSGSSILKVIGQTLNFYDGNSFEGLSSGKTEQHGALVRSESLVFTEEILHQAYRSGETISNPPEAPPYLVPDGKLITSKEYPQEFIDNVRALEGYVFHGGGQEQVRGYFVNTSRQEFDFQAKAQQEKSRGLLKRTKDPFGQETIISGYLFDLLPTKVTDPLGLDVHTEYNLRLLQPNVVIDSNHNRSKVVFTPLGLVKNAIVLGKENEAAGDTASAPGVQFEYNFFAFINEGKPACVRTIQREYHVTETDVPQPLRDATLKMVEYSDGFGRLLQTRTQAEDITFGAALPADQTLSSSDIMGSVRFSDTPKNVIVSGAATYNNKGQAVEQFEPYYDLINGFEYSPSTTNQQDQKTSMFYDPRGQVVRTVYSDGSEQQVVYGVPGSIGMPDLSNPNISEPTPWEAYTYDANDNAERTHGSDELTDRSHFNTPTSIEIDAMGRTIKSIERNGTNVTKDWYTTRSKYDLKGNLLVVTDALGRNAFRYHYDLANNPLRIESIDAGLRRIVLNATGNEIERRDSKGALILQAYDRVHRPIHIWARDDHKATSQLTLREHLRYGDGSDPDQNSSEREANRTLNRLGQLIEHYDEAGRLSIGSYDFKGNEVNRVRDVISDASILHAADLNFQVDWQPPPGNTIKDHANSILDLNHSYETSLSYDALNRIKTMHYPQDVSGKRKEIRPGYNAAGRLENVSLDGKTYVEHIAYDANGHRSFVALGNGIVTQYAYDPKTFRLVRLRSERYTKPDRSTPKYTRKGTVIQDVAYTYDLIGNIRTIKDRTTGSGIPNTFAGLDSLDRLFIYDPIYRLTSANGRECDKSQGTPAWEDKSQCTDPTKTRAYSRTYKYDALGNMKQLKHIAEGANFARNFDIESGSNRLNSAKTGSGNTNSFSYAYDTNGNLVLENTERHFEWNHSDQLKRFRVQPEGAVPSISAVYLYDAAGMRIKKLVRKQGGEISTAVYIDKNFEHHQWVTNPTSKGENNWLHVMDDQQRIAMIRIGDKHPDDRGPSIQYHLKDHLSSSNFVLSEEGSFINREEHYPFGGTSFGSFAKKRFRFTGKEQDEESGLNYHGARYYASWLSRWISADPISSIQSSYSAFSNNPINYIDNDGLSPKPTILEQIRSGKFTKYLRIFVEGHAWTVGVAEHENIAGRTSDELKEGIDLASKENARELKKADEESLNIRKKASSAKTKEKIKQRSRVFNKVKTLANSRGMRTRNQGGFAKIQTMGFIAIVTTAGAIIITSEDRLDAVIGIAKSEAADVALGVLFFKLTKSTGIAGLLTMVVGIESDSPAVSKANAKHRNIKGFISDNFPDVLGASRLVSDLPWPIDWIKTKTSWRYTIKDDVQYNVIYRKIESLVDDPYELETASLPLDHSNYNYDAGGHIIEH